jgi:cytochrome d ubiquinol oxidase subunit II
MEFDLNTLWFFLITILWVAYFFLEGFDFGVGILLPFLGKDDVDRRVMVNAIGPVWDGNEVWLLVAGGATFAAFPEWYATLFSGFYLPLFLILVALIARGVAFEYRGKDKRPEWKAWWDRAIFFGSALPALLWGVAFANIVRGVPIDSAKEYTGNLFTLLNPYALVVGITTFVLFTLHGAVFLSLKTHGPVAERASDTAKRLALPMAGLGVIVLVWTFINESGDLNGTDIAAVVGSVLVALAAVGAVFAVLRGTHGWAFVGTGLTILLVTVTLFLYLYPNVMPSSTNAAYGLDIHNASSTTMTLKVMTVVALIFTPIVLGYQAWSYRVFRKRVHREQFTTTESV